MPERGGFETPFLASRFERSLHVETSKLPCIDGLVGCFDGIG